MYVDDDQAVYDEEGGSQEWSALQEEDCSGLPSDDLLKNAGGLILLFFPDKDVHNLECAHSDLMKTSLIPFCCIVPIPLFRTNCIFSNLLKDTTTKKGASWISMKGRGSLPFYPLHREYAQIHKYTQGSQLRERHGEATLTSCFPSLALP